MISTRKPVETVDLYPSVRRLNAQRTTSHRRRPGLLARLLCWIGGR